MPPAPAAEDFVLLRVRVQPRASREGIRREPDGLLRISLQAPPVEGAANAALCELLARQLKLAKSRVHVVSGQKSREKTVRIEARAVEVASLLKMIPA